MGAGVLLLEHHTVWQPRTGQFRSGLAVLLFRDRRTGRFTDAGGSTDAGETGEQTASRELFEESAGLFNIDLTSSGVSKHRVVLSSGYTAYVVGVRAPRGNVCRGLFLRNASLIDTFSGTMPPTMQETDDMRHVFVQDIVASGAMTCNSRRAAAIPIPDATGAPVMLSKRTACVLQKAHSGGALCQRRLAWNALTLGWTSTPLPRDDTPDSVQRGRVESVRLRSYGNRDTKCTRPWNHAGPHAHSPQSWHRFEG